MKILRHRTPGKLFLLLFAVLIGMGSLFYTGTLVKKLKVEERENVEMWAEATRLISLSDTSQNLDFLFSIIDNNNTIPVILTDEDDRIISSMNFDESRIKDSSYLKNNLRKIKRKEQTNSK